MPDESAVNVTADNIKRGVEVIVAAGTQAQYTIKDNGETINEGTTIKINVVTNNTIKHHDRKNGDMTMKRSIDDRKETANTPQVPDRDHREKRIEQGTQAENKEGVLKEQRGINRKTLPHPNRGNR